MVLIPQPLLRVMLFSSLCVCLFVSRIIQQVIKEFWREAASQGDFSLGKFNVTHNCLCGRPIRMLVDSRWGNPNVRTTGNGAWWRADKSRCNPLSKVPLLWADLNPHLTHSSSGPSDSISQTASWSVQPICRVHGRYRQTDWPKDGQCNSIRSNSSPRTGLILVSALHKFVTYLLTWTLTNLLTAPGPTRCTVL